MLFLSKQKLLYTINILIINMLLYYSWINNQYLLHFILIQNDNNL